MVILLTLSSSKLIFIFLTLRKSRLTLFIFSTTLDRSQLFYWVWAGHARKNKPKTSRTTHKDLVQIIFNDSVSRNQELVSSVNKYASKVQSFIFSCNTFSDFCNKIKYDINKETKSFTELGKYLLNAFLWQCCQGWYLE